MLLALLPMAARSVEDAGDLTALRSRASELSRQGRFAEAAVFSERARELAERRLGPRDPELAETLTDIAYLYLRLGRHGDAAILFGRALAIYDGLPNPTDGRVWNVARLLAEAYTKQGRAADAEAALARARAIEQSVSAPFEIEIAVPYEIITTDLKRLRTHDCGVVSFKVDDPHALLFNFESIARAQVYIRLEVNSALRRIVGGRSSAQVRGEADQIGRELKASLEELPFGYSVRAVPESIASCLR